MNVATGIITLTALWLSGVCVGIGVSLVLCRRRLHRLVERVVADIESAGEEGRRG